MQRVVLRGTDGEEFSIWAGKPKEVAEIRATYEPLGVVIVPDATCACGRPITEARLKAKPGTTVCVFCAVEPQVRSTDVTSHNFSAKPGVPRGYPGRRKR